LLCFWVIFNFTYEFVASESRHNIQDASIGNKIGFLTNTDGREMVVANVCQEFKHSYCHLIIIILKTIVEMAEKLRWLSYNY